MKLLISLLLCISLISCPKDDLLIGKWKSFDRRDNTQVVSMKFSNDSAWVKEGSHKQTGFKLERKHTENLDLYFIATDSSFLRELKIYYKFKNKDLLYLDTEPINDFILKQNTEKFKRVK